MVTSSRLSLQYFPWLRLSDRVNIKSMYDRGPYVYWYKVAEVDLLLTSVGFRIVGIGSSYQLKKRRLCASSATLLKEPMNDMLYVEAKKVSAHAPARRPLGSCRDCCLPAEAICAGGCPAAPS